MASYQRRTVKQIPDDDDNDIFLRNLNDLKNDFESFSTEYFSKKKILPAVDAMYREFRQKLDMIISRLGTGGYVYNLIIEDLGDVQKSLDTLNKKLEIRFLDEAPSFPSIALDNSLEYLRRVDILLSEYLRLIFKGIRRS